MRNSNWFGGAATPGQSEDPEAHNEPPINPDTVPDEIDPAAIAKKMAAGLTRDQAIEVLVNQAAHDKEQAKSANN